MAKTKAPLFSLHASGNVANGSVQFRATRNGPVAVRPSPPGAVNPTPPSAAQVANRQRFAAFHAAWLNLAESDRHRWDELAAPRGLSGYHYFLSQLLRQPPVPPDAYLTSAGTPLLTSAGAPFLFNL